MTREQIVNWALRNGYKESLGFVQIGRDVFIHRTGEDKSRTLSIYKSVVQLTEFVVREASERNLWGGAYV
jgi:hypothetical protein